MKPRMVVRRSVSEAREETKRAGEALVVGLVVGVFHLAFVSGRFATEEGTGGLQFLFGCTFTTGILWAMLALRSLAADKPAGPEIDDGLTSMAVTAWAVALIPPRAENYLSEGSVDDFSRVYVPVCLLVVFVVLGAQALWPKREVRLLWLRLFASLAVTFFMLAGFLVFLSGGEGAVPGALRSAGFGTVTLVAAGVQWWRSRAG
ncbi:MAG: hypothetical protein Q8K32_00770 [Archangium sp.]|nr:hypothetical protein [Archangium sp.]